MRHDCSLARSRNFDSLSELSSAQCSITESSIMDHDKFIATRALRLRRDDHEDGSCWRPVSEMLSTAKSAESGLQ
jgi:hypothetical protein